MLKNFTNKLENIFSSKKIDENSLSELEEILLISDVGIETVDKIISILRNAKFSGNFDIAEVKSKLSEIIFNIVEPYQTRLPTINTSKPMAILCVGVNGSGKTTTIAKLAHFYKKLGYSGVLGAADTFRAAASDQLSEWAQKLNLKIIISKQNADPASVGFDTIDYTLHNSFNLCLIDTAGRLQNRSDLMEELKKIDKVIKSKDKVIDQKTIMIIDGTTGQSSIQQVREFSKYINIDGLILSKLDGSAIGGTIISIIDQLKVPIMAIGTGENENDLKEFDAKDFIKNILER
mgnify:FL=1